MKKFILYASIILTLALSLFTHFYRINDTYIFQNDEGRDALITYKMIDSGLPILLGPETSVGNMYLGPIYYYLLVPSLLLSNLSPVGPAMLVGLFGFATTILLILLGKKYGSIYAGIFAGLFYTLSPVMLHYSRSSWNPNVVPFFVTLLLIAYPLKSNIGKLIFGALTGILFQLHYVALIMPALLYLKDLIFDVQSKTWKSLVKNTSLILLGFVITSSPFWLFEVRHSFVNSQAFITYLSTKSSEVAPESLGYVARVSQNITTITSGIIGSSSIMLTPLPMVTLISIFVALLLAIISQRTLLIYILLGTILVVSALKERVHVHYISHLFPVLSLIIGQSLTRRGVFGKVATLIMLILLVSPTLSSHEYNLFQKVSSEPKRAKDVADYINRQAAGKPYNVVNSQGSYTTTISYYLAISDNPPSNELQDTIFDICVGGYCPIDDETTVLLFLTGPAHPAISDYLGHPQMNEFALPRRIITNEWVTYDVYVATMQVMRNDRIKQ